MKNTKLVKCPMCGHSHRVETRAPIGEGTRKGKYAKKLNLNKMRLLEIAFDSGELMHVRQFSAKLFETHERRFRSGDTDKPSGHWNYHNIQSDLSFLVGADMLTMSTDLKNKWDEDLQQYTACPLPKYYMDWLQIIRWDSVKDTADVSGFDKRSASQKGGFTKEANMELMKH